MDFYYCIVLMYCFILGKICDYFFYNLSFSFILLKNVDGFLMKNIFFNILVLILIVCDCDCKFWYVYVVLFFFEIMM